MISLFSPGEIHEVYLMLKKHGFLLKHSKKITEDPNFAMQIVDLIKNNAYEAFSPCIDGDWCYWYKKQNSQYNYPDIDFDSLYGMVSALCDVGLNVFDVKTMIKNHELATSIVYCCEYGDITYKKPFPSIEEAFEIMGNNFIGPDLVKNYFFLYEDQLYAPRIPFTKEFLVKNKNAGILIYDPGISISHIATVFSTETLRKKWDGLDDFRDKEETAKWVFLMKEFDHAKTSDGIEQYDRTSVFSVSAYMMKYGRVPILKNFKTIISLTEERDYWITIEVELNKITLNKSACVYSRPNVDGYLTFYIPGIH